MVTGPASSGGALPAVARPGAAAREWRAGFGQWASGLSRRAWQAPGLAPAGGLALMALLVFWNDLVHGVTYYGADTLSFYYPLTTWYAAQFRGGHLPLWVPYIFGGYPLFADGEVGMLYPLHLLLYGLLPSDEVFVWLRPIHFWLAGLFTYWLARLLGAQRLGALLAGLTFSYGSFLVGHLQHENVIRSTIWLPLAIGLLELALRAEGRTRLGWLLACGLVVGVQALGVHVQPVLLTLTALGAYALAGPLVPERDERPKAKAEGKPPTSFGLGPRAFVVRPSTAWRYLRARVLSLLLVAVVGLGVGAAQLLPLYQLGERSLRSGGVSYEFSSSYSVPPAQLVQLLLPYLFRPDQTSYWGLWSAAETTIYLGIAPLLLALVALAYLHTRPVAFLGLLAGGSLLLALGDYLPLKLYSLIWSLPGFSFLRVPARFSLLVVLAGALLAGFGADWLSRRAFDVPPQHLPHLRVRRLLLLALGCSGGALVLAVGFALAREWLNHDPGGTRRAIESYYLSLRRGEFALTASTVYYGLLKSLDPANPRTLGALALMLAVSILLILRGLHRCPGPAWRVALLALVAVDLAIFALGFYPQRPVSALTLSLPSIRFLAEHNGLHRVFVEPGLYGLLGPNQLVGSRIDLAGGYSSLEPRRAVEYWWSIVRQDSVLLDLYNVRYVVAPRHTPGLLAYEGMLYHPTDRLMRGAVGNPSGTQTFELGTWWTEAISIVGAGEGWHDVPRGTPVAEITLRGPDGERQVLVRAGQHVDDGAPLFGPPAPGAPAGPRRVWSGPSLQGPNPIATLYGATLWLEQPILATSLTVRRIGPPGAFNLHGLGLHDRAGLPVKSLVPTDRAKYRRVYQDEDVNIFENQAALPRAFLAGAARQAEPGSTPVVDQLLLGPFDPRRTIMLDADVGSEAPTGPQTTGDQGSDLGTATITDYGTDRVMVQVEARQPGYLVLADRYDDSWRARVDGRPAPLLRADAMFRAVPIEAGTHMVEFTYEPLSLSVGAAISVATLTLGLAALGGLWSTGWVRRGRREGR